MAGSKSTIREVLALAVRPVAKASDTANKWITLVSTLAPLGLAFLKLPVVWAAWLSVCAMLLLVFWAGIRLQRDYALTAMRSVREQLASFVVSGDRAWNAARFAHQMWEKAQMSVLPALPTPAIPDWSPAVLGWINEVEAYLRSTTALGPSYADLFIAQEPGLSPGPDPQHPLSTEQRTQQDMELIRLKQGRLRTFIEDYKG